MNHAGDPRPEAIAHRLQDADLDALIIRQIGFEKFQIRVRRFGDVQPHDLKFLGEPVGNPRADQTADAGDQNRGLFWGRIQARLIGIHQKKTF